MRRFISIVLFVTLLPLSVQAQGNFREEYEKFKKQSVTSYTHFRDQCNEEFIEFLKQSWTYYEAGPALEKPTEEEVPPVIRDKGLDPIPAKENPIPFDEVIPPLPIELQPRPIEPIQPQPRPLGQEKWVYFDLYNTPMKLRVEDKNIFRLKSLEGDDIAQAWQKLSGKAFDNVLLDCLKLREDYHLCDWAYLQALLAFSKSYLPSQDEAILLTAYLFSQSGYQMRLGVVDNKELTMLFGSQHRIYGYPCYKISGTGFYPISGSGKGLRVADFSFPKEKGMSLVIDDEPVLSSEISELRQLTATRSGIQAACSVNKNLLAFYEDYPSSQWGDNLVTRWAIYANAPLDSVTKEQLYPSFKEAISGKSKAEAVGILLDFVQTAFEYDSDNKIWGHDRAFFSEETLFYPSCDCEDRAILFSRLVRDLTGLDVMLVYYPGHLASAVQFDEEVTGDYISLNNKKYLVCDPTYIGAPVGMSMPDMDNKTAKVILLKR